MQSHKDKDDVVSPTEVTNLSAKAGRNMAMMELLAAELRRDPEIEMSISLRKIQREIDPPKKPRAPLPIKMSFRERLVTGPKTLEIVFPLSKAVTTLLDGYQDSHLAGKKHALASALQNMIAASTILWERDLCGAVLKFNDEIAAKIVWGSTSHTEYSSLQYLEAHAPGLPVPRPHGLIKFSNQLIMFMTYIPTTTLQTAWRNLTAENKLSIQDSLQSYFVTLRSLKMPLGHNMGGVRGEGVQDFHMVEHKPQLLKTMLEFEDWQFSVDEDKHPPSRAFTTFLRNFLPPSSNECVFTHGDLRPANIMVKQNAESNYIISGIIDWEMSGFYPEYVESMQVLHLFNRHDESDWYHYLPHCISPARHPERFLVGRIWDTSLGF
ncbi:hypothetical protein HYFRA_00011543 [Hymenoscyphus fraxineus]|uniref:Aminoglycoside phosphotransferase domain-containing protein n=1 Tax=Hymenoscyphus fraxineus TaxID=746836 RepID=A0A9N9PT30_9HELO|nr:hypothetical protein HYFRA_00011543 [Hymenoscyphus fraxineus]